MGDGGESADDATIAGATPCRRASLTPLLEREAEIAAADEAIAHARGGIGGVLVIEGPAGIGKTAVLDEARHRAERQGARVALARGGTLEREIAHGVVRQLLEPPVRAATRSRRAALLTGAAALAAPVVLSEGPAVSLPEGAATDQRAPVIHGLYWLTANLAAEAPLLLAVDDAQWSDAASLRFLLYLARRLDGLPIVLLVAARTGEVADAPEALAELRLAATRVLCPAPLTSDAVEELTRTHLAAAPDREFVTACREATGGVPYLVTELLSAMSSRGVTPSAAAAGSVPRVTSRTVAHATMLRLSRLAPAATEVAQAVAVLGRHADLRRVARLSRLDDEVVLLEHDALAEANILRPGQPMGFVHPIVSASIYDEMPAGQRALAHAAAARILAAESADAEEVAGHILLTEPGSAHEFLDPLRAAAASALGRGAPESGVSYLRRALHEASEVAARVRLLFDLGSAEALARDPAAVAHLEEAHRCSDDPALRAAITVRLAPVIGYLGRWRDAGRLVRAAIDELGGGHVDLVAELEAAWAALSGFDPDLVEDFDGHRASLRDLAAKAGPAGRQLALVLAALSAYRGQDDLRDVVPLVERGLDGGRMLAEAGSRSWPVAMGGQALVLVEELDAARRLAEDMLADARRSGSVFGFEAASALRAFVHNQAGDLASSEADLRVALETAEGHGIVLRTVGTVYQCIDTLIERSRVDDLVGTVESLELEPELGATAQGGMLLEARGRLRLAAGRRAAAVEDLRACGRIMEAIRWRNPVDSQWRSSLALALPPDARSEAARLVEEELELAQAGALPRAEGVALRVAGLLEGGERGVVLLRESLDVLERAPAPLERARTLVELGAALRRANQRALAREPLRAGLDLAHRCGADRLAARAEEELRATGAKPRRRAVSGLDSLTPNELRVARQAATGMGNREIAQALFVTTKTVETQLSTVYQKLGIRGRDELAVLIAGAATAG